MRLLIVQAGTHPAGIQTGACPAGIHTGACPAGIVLLGTPRVSGGLLPSVRYRRTGIQSAAHVLPGGRCRIAVAFDCLVDQFAWCLQFARLRVALADRGQLALELLELYLQLAQRLGDLLVHVP